MSSTSVPPWHMVYLKGGGKNCCVVGCTNNQKKVTQWRNRSCNIHSGLLHEECECPQPYQLHRFPKNEERRAQWAVNIRRENFTPSDHSVVCSYHFVDKRPTEAHPNPTLFLGYEETMASEKYAGPFCEELGITLPFSESKTRITDKRFVTNGFVREVCNHVGQDGATVVVLLDLLDCDETFNPGSVRASMMRMREREKKLKNTPNFESWLKEQYHLPRQRVLSAERMKEREVYSSSRGQRDQSIDPSQLVVELSTEVCTCWNSRSTILRIFQQPPAFITEPLVISSAMDTMESEGPSGSCPAGDSVSSTEAKSASAADSPAVVTILDDSVDETATADEKTASTAPGTAEGKKEVETGMEQDVKQSTQDVAAKESEKDVEQSTQDVAAKESEKDVKQSTQDVAAKESEKDVKQSTQDVAAKESEKDVKQSTQDVAAKESEKDVKQSTQDVAAKESEKDVKQSTQDVAAKESEKDVKQSTQDVATKESEKDVKQSTQDVATKESEKEVDTKDSAVDGTTKESKVEKMEVEVKKAPSRKVARKSTARRDSSKQQQKEQPQQPQSEQKEQPQKPDQPQMIDLIEIDAEDVNEKLKAATAVISDVESEADKLQRELDQVENMMADLGRSKFDPSMFGLPEDTKFIIDVESIPKLEAMITEKLKALHLEEIILKSAEVIEEQINSAFRKSREVDRLFSECTNGITSLQEQLAADQALENTPNLEASGSDSDDDDVQFVSTSFDPTRKQQAQQQQPPQQVLYLRPGQPLPPGHMMGMNQQNLISLLPQQPSNQTSGLTVAQLPLPKLIDLAVGVKMYGRKSNEIWYKGTIVDILQKGKEPTRYKLKFDSKGMKALTGKHVALSEPPTGNMPVGSRVVAMYKDEDASAPASFYAGVVAESPSTRNSQRYLVFFDDGYAQYSMGHDLRQVYEQSKNVWEDIHPDSQEFIKSYLKQYPERPMVRLQKNQTIKTEWNGTWWTAKVEEVDASLVKMYFEADNRVEWIYRGSTRLEPLYTELANAEASKASGKGRRHNVKVKSNQKPYVEYTRYAVEESQAVPQQQPGQQMQLPPRMLPPGGMRQMPPGARNQQVMMWPPPQQQQQQLYMPGYPPSHPMGRQPVTILRQTSNDSQGEKKRSVARKSTAPSSKPMHLLNKRPEYESYGQHVPTRTVPNTQIERPKFRPHTCCKTCLKDAEDDPVKYRGCNPLQIPILCGWERQIARQKNYGKRVVFYRAPTPCLRRLRNIEDVDQYLTLTQSNLTIDLFCFDVMLHTQSEFVPIKTFCDIKDLSYGKETVPISCVNGIDRQYPDYVEYSNVRIPAKGVSLNLEEEFFTGCDCTDGCKDPAKCACIQLTIRATEICSGGKPDMTAGYSFRRLSEQLITGVYECNKRCKCSSTCFNRVAQNGLQLRLQVFKTEKRGWGLRCLDDIPSGGFICVYAGQLLTEQGANEDGQQYGDEYLAELDYIEVVERLKEGYESDVENIDEGVGDDDELSSEGEGDPGAGSDSTYSGEKQGKTKRRRRKNKDSDAKSSKEPNRLVLKRDSKSDESWSVTNMKDLSSEQKTAEWVKNIPDAPAVGDEAIVILSDDEDGESSEKPPSEKKDSMPKKEELENPDDLPDLEPMESNDKGSTSATPSKNSKKDEGEAGETGTEDGIAGLMIIEPTSLNVDNVDENDSGDEGSKKETKEAVEGKEGELSYKRTTRSQSRFHNLPDPKAQKKLKKQEGQADDGEMEEDKEEKEVKESKPHKAPESPEEKPFFKTRLFFDKEEFCYVMDAKSMGNIGRYLNHSCQPNVFVQNVFVDTHDLRFPWVAFFASQYIRAGTELTWDYNYEVGSVPGKILYCYCGAAECRGRLL